MNEWDAGDEDAEADGPPPPDDRLWRHPSELVTRATPEAAAATSRASRPQLSIGGAIVAATIGATLMLGAVTLIDMNRADEPEATPDTTEPAATPVASLQGEPATTVSIQFTTENAVERTAALVIGDTGHLAAVNSGLDGATSVEAIVGDNELVPLTVLAVDDATGIAVLEPTAKLGLPPTVGAPVAVASEIRVGVPGAPPAELGSVITEHTTVSTDGHRQHGLLTVQAPTNDYVNVVFDTSGQRVVGLISPLDPRPGDLAHFVVPYEIIERVTTDYLTHGDTTAPSLGVTATAPPVPNIDGKGLRVETAEESATLQPGDELVMLGGVQLRHLDDLASQLLRYSRGDTVRASIDRGQQRIDLEITLGSTAT